MYMLSTIHVMPLIASVPYFYFETDLFYFCVTYCIFTNLLLAITLKYWQLDISVPLTK